MNTNTTGIAAARQAHSTRCRQRVIAALEQAAHQGSEISISAIARRAKVDRSFLYRHRDLHSAVLAKAAEPTTTKTGGPAVSRASLIADLANAHDRITRLSRENTQLRQRLSESLGEQIWRESGLGAPDDVDRLQRRVTELEQHAAEQRRQLAERNDELDAARAANRDLMAHLNRPQTTGAAVSPN
ncbi:DUF6262 family protein [Arthrobacter sp. efr-133-R2A-120]|uniref:DUF6262 family protein n=1 Tax=Arthrobacter sp. efr-133-R2A-120 TaxID=3040277 RepID=UPI00254CBCC4|nr:DUF6262 family protein [Arthrobacter sp. efr-133-R2A-120]